MLIFWLVRAELPKLVNLYAKVIAVLRNENIGFKRYNHI